MELSLQAIVGEGDLELDVAIGILLGTSKSGLLKRDTWVGMVGSEGYLRVRGSSQEKTYTDHNGLLVRTLLWSNTIQEGCEKHDSYLFERKVHG
jgi:hypothetical protein